MFKNSLCLVPNSFQSIQREKVFIRLDFWSCPLIKQCPQSRWKKAFQQNGFRWSFKTKKNKKSRNDVFNKFESAKKIPPTIDVKIAEICSALIHHRKTDQSLNISIQNFSKNKSKVADVIVPRLRKILSDKWRDINFEMMFYQMLTNKFWVKNQKHFFCFEWTRRFSWKKMSALKFESFFVFGKTKQEREVT